MKTETISIVYSTEDPEAELIIQTQDPDIVALATLMGASESEYDSDVLVVTDSRELNNFAVDNDLTIYNCYGKEADTEST